MAINQNQLSAYFNQYLGRDITPPELEYLNRIGKEGGLGDFELGQIIQSLPEAQTRQVQQTGPQIEQALAGGDQRFLERAGDQLTQQFYKQGRPVSSGYTAAYFNAARDLGIQRQHILGQYYAGSLGQQPERAFSVGQETQARGFGERETLRRRDWDIHDYESQKNFMMDAYNMQNRKNYQNALWGAGANVAGGITSMFGGPIGGLIGTGLKSFGKSFGG